MFSVYAHLNPITLKPFYIGKGKGVRYKSSTDRSAWWVNYSKKHGFIPIILVDGLDNIAACEIEKQYIKKYGFIKSGGLLINQTSGGEGGNTFDPIGGKNWNSGKTGIYTKEAIDKMRFSRLGKKHPPDVKERVLVGLRKAAKAKILKSYKVKCLQTGKEWANRWDCINDLGISLASFKQYVFRGKKITYIKN